MLLRSAIGPVMRAAVHIAIGDGLLRLPAADHGLAEAIPAAPPGITPPPAVPGPTIAARIAAHGLSGVQGGRFVGRRPRCLEIPARAKHAQRRPSGAFDRCRSGVVQGRTSKGFERRPFGGFERRPFGGVPRPAFVGNAATASVSGHSRFAAKSSPRFDRLGSTVHGSALLACSDPFHPPAASRRKLTDLAIRAV